MTDAITESPSLFSAVSISSTEVPAGNDTGKLMY